jgi:uncharacterized protein
VRYRASLFGFVAFFALILLTLVDFRRGFLFGAYPVRSVFYAFHPAHMAMFASGLVGMAVCYGRLKSLDRDATDAARYIKPLTFIVLALLVVDLFAYRAVPAARSIASGRVGVDWLNAFGVTGWWRPVAQATSYLANVWHATLLGVLLSGLALTILPVYLAPYFVRPGFTGSVIGALFALPQPFCSCCSSVMAPSFARRGASMNFLLSFVVGAPMLNITTLILALALLPAPFAALRVVAGAIVTVLVTYVVARVGERWEIGEPVAHERVSTPRSGALQRIGAFYARLLDLDKIVGSRRVDAPSRLLATWAYASGRIALVLVPTLWAWSVVASALFRTLPSAFGNNLPSVVLAAIGGTLFMISTWSEIPMALQLIQSGYTGPAAALLVVLPAISLPCMVLLGGSLQRFRTVGLLSVAVMVAGIIAGALFL